MKKFAKLLVVLLVLTLAVTCLVACGETPCEHTYTDDYTCHDRACTKCGEVSTATTVHSYADDYTCHSRNCTVCGEVKVATTSHNFDNQLIKDEYVFSTATCTQKARYYYICDCGEKGTQTFEYGDTLGHSWGEYVSDNNATYTSDGTKTAECTRNDCNATDTITDAGTKLASSISFNTLEVEGLNVNGVVNTNITEFSFINEISVVGVAEYVIAYDLLGEQQIQNKIVPLQEGENQFYVFEKLGGNVVKTYDVKLYRVFTYTVTFETLGGTLVAAQDIIEGGLLQAVPNPEKDGYAFVGWDYDFSIPVNADFTVTAEWRANTDTEYCIEYYFQNIEDDDYTIISEKTERKFGTTDSTVSAIPEDIDYFVFNETISTTSGDIAGDGSLTLKLYYDRVKHTVTFDANGGTLSNGNLSQQVKHEGSAKAPILEKTGYRLVGYDIGFTNITEPITVTAQWEINQYTLTIVYDNGQDDKVITQDYNTPIEAISNPTHRAGYDFAGWDKDIPTIMPAEDVTVTAVWDAIFTRNGGTITGLTTYGEENYTEIVIPSQIDGDDITAIGESAFSLRGSKITSIVIPESITRMGAEAFSQTKLLSKVYFEGTIDQWAQIDFDDTITSNPISCLRDYNFNLQTAKRELYINDTLVTDVVLTTANKVSDYAFAGYWSLKSAVVSDSVTSIGKGAFADCQELESITLPFVGAKKDSAPNTHFQYVFGASNYSYESYYDGYFVGNKLETVVITGGSVITVNAFYNCSKIKSITIPNSIRAIGERAFYGCTLLESINIPNGVTSIENEAFYNCSSLTSVKVPDSVGSIGYGAFGCCANLESITIPFVGAEISDTENSHFGYIFGASSYTNNADKLPTLLKTVVVTKDDIIDDYAFYNCTLLTSIAIPDSVKSIGLRAFYQCSSLESVTFGEDSELESIGSNAFSNCTSLRSITVPDSVTSIGNGAFSGCALIESVTLPFVGATKGGTNNTHFGYIFGSQGYSHNSDYVSESLRTVVITGGENIGAYAFYDCNTVTNITILEGVTNIGNYAFVACASLTSITIPNSLTSIGYRAFSSCTSLTSITIPDSVTSIGIDAFNYCNSLKKVNYLSTLDQWVKISFASYTANPLYYAKKLYIDDVLVEDVVLTNATKINEHAFNGCGLKSITIPDSVMSIGNYAFYNCTSLTSITIPDSVTSIGSQSFYGCPIEKATLPTHAISYIKNSNLKEVVITSGESIGSSAFSGCDLLTSIEIPDSVTSIGTYAFRECTSLTSIVISDNVIEVGYYAFYGCYATTVYCQAESKPDGWNADWDHGGATVWDCDNNDVADDGYVYTIFDGIRYGIKNGEARVVRQPSNTITANITQVIAYKNNAYSVTKIDASAFEGTAFYNDENNWENGILYGGNNLLDANDTISGSCTIKDGTRIIAVQAFYECHSLTSITIPDSVTSIGNYVFGECTSLQSVTFEDGGILESIGYAAFAGCTSLTSITIPDSVTSIGSSAFYNCTMLESITLPFVGATKGGTENTHFGYIFGAPTSDYNVNYYLTSLKTVTITGGESIGNNAFNNWTSITSITIPGSVTSMENRAFYECYSLEKVNYLGTIDQWVEINFANKYSNPLYHAGDLYIQGELITDVTLSVATKISAFAFYNYDSLNSITISDSVKSIGESAFEGCISLKEEDYLGTIDQWAEIAFGNARSNPTFYIGDLYINGEKVVNATLSNATKISTAAFYKCTSLKTITFAGNSKITSIGDYAFNGCTSLTSITIPDSVMSIGEYVFYNCTSLESITLPFVGAEKDGEENTYFSYLFGSPFAAHSKDYVPKSLKNVVITMEDNLDFEAFVNCEPLVSIVIPKSVVTMENSVFGGSPSLTIYCEATSKPDGWDDNWNSSNYPVVWSYGAYTRDGDYIYFGEYPQTIKDDSVTVSSTVNANGYYTGSDGAQYAKVVADPYSSGYKFSTNDTIASGQTYYFKVEPIRWRILEEVDGTALILCDSIIANNCFDDSLNNYKDSDVRKWLNDEFYNTAFDQYQQSIILVSTVDNSSISTGNSSNQNACDDTEDKVFLLSCVEATNSAYGLDLTESRKRLTSDYVRASGAYMSTSEDGYGDGLWWLRSPNANDSNSAYCSSSDGTIIIPFNAYVSETSLGIVPALRIRL